MKNHQDFSNNLKGVFNMSWKSLYREYQETNPEKFNEDIICYSVK